MQFLNKEKQKRIWDEARIAAGPRYTKEINVDLPIKEVFDGIARTDQVFVEIDNLRKELKDTFKLIDRQRPHNDEKIIRKNLSRIRELGKELVKFSDSFGKDRSKNLDLKGVHTRVSKISKYFSPIDRVIWDIERKEEEEQRKKAEEEKQKFFGHSPSEKVRDLKNLEHDLNEFQRATRKLEYFSRNSKAKLVNEPFLLILGQAGMGKTHLVCDITKERIERKLPPTVIVLGEKMLDIDDPLESIFKACSLKGTKTSILRELNTVGKKKKTRSLIIIDAINEADRKGWKAGIRNLIKELRRYPWIGLVMTCRVPFESLSLPKHFKITTEYHRGFTDNELEAMVVFFNFYKISLPEVPLLISEFSSPLFLSCFCKTAQNIKGGKAKVVKGIKDLALGQVGMTKILEDFYITKESQIVKKYSSKYKLVIKQSWIWNKGGDDCLIKSLARQMAGNSRRYLEQGEVLDVLKGLSGDKYQQSTCFRILKILIDEGVLISDAAWDDNTKQYKDVYKFSFHKFSDHIIARYLLEDYFDRNKVKKSLSAQNALGDLFHDQQSILNNIDLIEALMVEFPERIKKNGKLHEKDLIDFIPKQARNASDVMSAFIESLYWRKPENFLNKNSQIKKSIIDYINKVLLRYRDSSRDLFDLFVSTATKPFHPLNAKRLHNYLFGFSVPNRDLFWSEYLRKQYGAGSVYKLISWIESQNLEKITAEQARCVITILGWVLTTNVRLLRNRATRCIYIVGKIHPEECFRVAVELSKANDPYVAERILAASYGVSMTINSRRKGAELKILYLFAKKVYSMFFKKQAPYGTTHTLIRDYVRGIIEVALVTNKCLLSDAQIKRIRPIYMDGGIRRWGRSKDKNNGEYRNGNAPLGMDFENYTLGRLVPNRSNYDYKNKGFIKVKENMLWRIYQLGYSLEKFGEIDKEIVSNSRLDRGSDYAGKVDRYGKKYCWITYYELLGLKIDKKELDRWWISEDGRGGELDLDPSFPQTPIPERKRLINNNLTKGPRNIKKWLVQKVPPDISSCIQLSKIDRIDGPWVLVHGTIGEKNAKLSRRITTFIDGILIDQDDKHKLKEFLKNTKFPGNDNIPSLPEVGDIFAGELGWRENYKRDDPLFIKIQRGEKRVKLTRREKQFYSIRFVIKNAAKDDLGIVKDNQKPPEYKTELIYEEIQIEQLARWLSSKDYSLIGRDDYGIGLYVPSKKFIRYFRLCSDVSSFNLIDTKSGSASISFVRGDQYGTHENLLYLRKDLLDKFIKKSGKKLFLIAWGERQYWPKEIFKHRDDLNPIYQAYENVYKEIIEYRG